MTHPGPTEVYHAGSASFRKLNQHLVAGQVLPADPYQVGNAYETPQIERAGGGKRIRQKSGDGMNQWEREYAAKLARDWQYIYREVPLPLANGLRYKLDFLCVMKWESCDPVRWRTEGHEVKGQARSTGIAKLKMAARLYPWITFRLVTKRKKKDGGGWSVEEVLK